MAVTTVRDTVLGQLRMLDPRAFVESRIFDCIPHLFSADRALFVDWKRQVANALGVDPADLTVVGSAAVGVSLNPNKAFRVFNDQSDIDVAVISAFHFQTAWRFLRQNSAIRAKLGTRERGAWDEHRSNLIFWGTIATDKLLPRFPFGAEWRKALDAVQQRSPFAQSINMRVYQDYEALRSYQLQSVRSRQQDLLLTGLGS